MTTTRILDNGWDMNTLTTHKVNQESENPQILQMKRELQEMKREMVEKGHQLERKERLSEVRAYLGSNRDDFEFTLMHNYESKVVELMDHYYENEKKLLSVSEAAKAIEVELEKFEKQKAENLANSKKGKEFYKTALGTKSPSSPSTQQSRSQQSETQAGNTQQAFEHSLQTSEPPSKPRSILPPVVKKPLLKHLNANPLTKEVDGSFKHPSRGKSKSEVMQRIVAAFGQK